MNKFALRLVLLFAAVMVGAWPAVAGLGQPVMAGHAHAHAEVLAMHHMDAGHGSHGGHGAMDDDQAADCCGGSDAMAMIHCASGSPACGTAIAGTIPTVAGIPSRPQGRIVHWLPPDDAWMPHAASPTLRPPRHSS
ncbi:MAG: hypothetical protein AB1918_04435 [Pseudomonadota bacterium]